MQSFGMSAQLVTLEINTKKESSMKPKVYKFKESSIKLEEYELMCVLNTITKEIEELERSLIEHPTDYSCEDERDVERQIQDEISCLSNAAAKISLMAETPEKGAGILDNHIEMIGTEVYLNHYIPIQ